MSEINIKQKNKLLKKLKTINILTEKDIQNVKVSDLKKINENENISNLSLKKIIKQKRLT